MKTKLITLIIGILLLSVIIAGAGLIERQSTLNKEDKDTLTNIGLTDIIVSPISCKDYCYFEISKSNLLNARFKIEPYTSQCNSKGICVQVLKGDKEIEAEKDKLINEFLTKYAEYNRDLAKQETIPTKIGNEELIIIGGKT